MVAGPLGPYGYEPIYGIGAGLPAMALTYATSVASVGAASCRDSSSYRGGTPLPRKLRFKSVPLGTARADRTLDVLKFLPSSSQYINTRKCQICGDHRTDVAIYSIPSGFPTAFAPKTRESDSLS